MKVCSKCGQLKPKSEFHKDKHKKDGLTNHCKTCVHERGVRYREMNKEVIYERNKQRYIKQKSLLDEIKTPCVKCGEDRLYLIQFHHINPSVKNGTVACDAILRSKENLMTEVDKCVCLCSNCHDEFHWFYGKHPEQPLEALTEYLGRSPYEV